MDFLKPAKLQPQADGLTSPQNTPCYPVIPVDKINSDFESLSLQSRMMPVDKTSSNFESQPLHLREIEAMDTSTPEDSAPLRRIKELEKEYRDQMSATDRPLYSTTTQHPEKKKSEKGLKQYQKGPRLPLKQQRGQSKPQKKPDSITDRHPWDEKHDEILMSYCKPELAEHIPRDKLMLLKDLMSSENSVLEPQNRLLILLLNDDKELRKVIENNPDLAGGTLDNMDKVVFQSGACLKMNTAKRLRIAGKSSAAICDYSAISFKEASFQNMSVKAIFRDCDFTHADFTGTNILECDFHGANLTAACFTKCWISRCNFDEANLTDIDFGGVRYLLYPKGENRDFSNTVSLLSQAITQYSSKDNNHQTASALRLLANMLTTRKLWQKAEGLYDELAQRQQAKAADFLRLGNQYWTTENDSGEKKPENKVSLAERAIAYLQKGWQVTSDNDKEEVTHNHLFIAAMNIMSETDSVNNWRPILEEIKSKGVRSDTNVLVAMAQLLTAKQADGEAMETLRQLVNNPEHFNKGQLAEICKAIQEIILRNGAFSEEAITLLNTATTLTGHDRLYIASLDLYLDKNRDICTRWLYRIDFLLQSEHSEDALKLISAMESTVSGAWQMLVEEDYDGTLPWMHGGLVLVDLVTKIKASLANICMEM